MSRPGLRSTDIARPALAFASRHRIGLMVALGAALRVREYLAGRTLWMDEAALSANIVGRPFRALFGPLLATQLAPAGFLAAEWSACRLLGPSTYALRLLPLLAGVAAVAISPAAARRVVSTRAVFSAVALIALADELIYFSSELKPYSVDVAAAVAALVLAGAFEGAKSSSTARLILTGLAAAALPWFSFPSAFALAGVGLAGWSAAIARGDRRALVAWTLAGLACAASVLGVYAVGQAQLGHKADMWAFWGFAFPPRPPGSAWDATWPVRRGLYFFVNPLNFDGPLGVRLSPLPAWVAFAVGWASLARRAPWSCAAATLPGALAMLAAYMRLYPFHGRLVLFLVPSALLIVAEGSAAIVGAVRSRLAAAAWLVALFAFPICVDAFHVLEPRTFRDGNPYGDRRPPWLDPYSYPLWPPKPVYPIRQAARRPGGTTNCGEAISSKDVKGPWGSIFPDRTPIRGPARNRGSSDFARFS